MWIRMVSLLVSSLKSSTWLTQQELDHVIELAQDEGLGIVLEEEAAKDILDRGANIKNEKADLKEKK